MNELALFAGAGGGILGGHLLGWRTICAVERDAYAAQVLAAKIAGFYRFVFQSWQLPHSIFSAAASKEAA